MADPIVPGKPVVSADGEVLGFDPIQLNDPIPDEDCWFCVDCNGVWWDREQESSQCPKCGRRVDVYTYS